jgi:DNA adenine methylase
MVSKIKSFIKYPGGKSRMIADIIPKLPLGKFTDVFVGGGSISIAYAEKHPTADIIMNDLDIYTYSMWDVVVNGTTEDINRLAALIRQEPTIDLFKYNRTILDTPDKVTRAYLAIFFHKTTFSGLFWGNPIGGFDQKSVWKIGCHYTAENIIDKIIKVRGLLRGRTTVTNLSFENVIETEVMYFDPPYVGVGDKLYAKSFNNEMHINLARYIHRLQCKWLLSYNDVPLVRDLYACCNVEKIMKKASMTSFADGGKCREKAELLISKA